MNDFDFSELRMPIASSEMLKKAEEGDIDFSELGQPPEEKSEEKVEEKPEVKKEPEEKKEAPKEDEAPKPTGLPSAKELDTDPVRYFDITVDAKFNDALTRAKDSNGKRIHGGTVTFKPLMKMAQRWKIEIYAPSTGSYEIIGDIEPAGIDAAIAEANASYNNELETIKISNKLASHIAALLVAEAKTNRFRFRTLSFRGAELQSRPPKKKKDGEEEKTKKPKDPTIQQRLLDFFETITKEEYTQAYAPLPFMVAELSKDKFQPIADILAKFKRGNVSTFNYHLNADDVLVVEDSLITQQEKIKKYKASSSLNVVADEQPMPQWAGPSLEQIAALVGNPAAAWASELAGALSAKFNTTFAPLGLKKK